MANKLTVEQQQAMLYIQHRANALKQVIGHFVTSAHAVSLIDKAVDEARLHLELRNQ